MNRPDMADPFELLARVLSSMAHQGKKSKHCIVVAVSEIGKIIVQLRDYFPATIGQSEDVQVGASRHRPKGKKSNSRKG
jgi:hypothetical protein